MFPIVLHKTHQHSMICNSVSQTWQMMLSVLLLLWRLHRRLFWNGSQFFGVWSLQCLAIRLWFTGRKCLWFVRMTGYIPSFITFRQIVCLKGKHARSWGKFCILCLFVFRHLYSTLLWNIWSIALFCYRLSIIYWFCLTVISWRSKRIWLVFLCWNDRWFSRCGHTLVNSSRIYWKHLLNQWSIRIYQTSWDHFVLRRLILAML